MKKNAGFITYVQKISVPENSRLLLFGDIHGGFHSLISMFEDLYNKKIIDNNFKLLDPNLYCAFLGDISDRGLFGVEAWYFIMRLKNANPKNVIVIRGNHEELVMNKHDGFLSEAKVKIPACVEKINGLYNLLPVACFLNQHALFCHGGLDHCCDTRTLCANPAEFACQVITPEIYNPQVLFSSFSDKLLDGIADAIIVATRDQALSLLNNALVGNKSDVTECCTLINKIQGSGIIVNVDDKKILEDKINVFNERALDFTNGINKLKERIVNLDEILNGLLRILTDITDITKKYEAPKDSIIRQCEDLHEFFLSIVADRLYDTCKKQIAQLSNPASIASIRSTLTRLFKIAKSPKDFEDLSGTELPSCMFMESVAGARAGILQEFFVSRIAGIPLTELGQCGHAWNDFDLEAEGSGPSIGLESEYRYCFSMALSRAIMEHQNIHVVIRAHQHYGPMQDLLAEHRGFVELWDRSTGDTVWVKKDSVYTLDVGYASTMRKGKVYDTITELDIKKPRDISTWVLKKNYVTPVLSRPTVSEIAPTGVFVAGVPAVVTAGIAGIVGTASTMAVLRSPAPASDSSRVRGAAAAKA
jgi:hypothetical protein